MLKLSEIQQVQIELTTRCNARCPMCMRNYRGFDYNSGYPIAELTLQQIQHILKPDFLKQLVHGVNFNGNLGDFGSARDAEEIVHYLCDHNVPVSINTNGSVRTPDWWAKLARPGVQIGFALNGLADTHDLYRLDTDYDKIIKNAQAFIDAGGQAIWRWITFDHNRHQEDACRKLSQEMGFILFDNHSHGRDRSWVYNRDGSYSHLIGESYSTDNSIPNVKDLLASHITWFDHKTIKHPNDITPLNIECFHKKYRDLYITATGDVYPCCFLGFYPDTMHHAGNEQLKHLVKENNALKYSLDHCIKWFDQVEETWNRESIADGRLYACVASCGQRNLPSHKLYN